MNARKEYTPRPVDNNQNLNNQDLREIIFSIYSELDKIKEDVNKLKAGG